MESAYTNRSRTTFRNRFSNVRSRMPAGTEELILAVVGVISCMSGFILNGDQTKISVLNQEISNTAYTWLSNILIFIGSPLLFFAAYVYSSGNILAKKYIVGVLILYGILIGIAGYLISQDQSTIFNMDSSASNTLTQFYGWTTLCISVIMIIYGVFLAYY